MWFIEQKKQPGKRVYFLSEEEYTVGRKETKIIIENDASISRNHSVFKLTRPDDSGHFATPFVLRLEDCGSKYGTCVNGKKLGANENVFLSGNDIITFGKLDSIWKVIHEPLFVATSCIESSDKMKIRRLVQKLGGSVLSEWTSSCQFLVMNSIKVTVKTVCALASQKHIVLPSFFSDAVEQISNNGHPSDPELFLPPIEEPSLEDKDICFLPDENRSQIFKSKVFIFFDRNQKNRLENGIVLAQGQTKYIASDYNSNLKLFIEPNVCVMNHITSSTQSLSIATQDPTYIEVVSFLKKNKKRMISESEIGLAIVHVSAENYCNPDFNLGKQEVNNLQQHHKTDLLAFPLPGAMLFRGNLRLQSKSISQQSVIAPETQQTDILKDTPMSKKRKTRLDDVEQGKQKIAKTSENILKEFEPQTHLSEHLKSDITHIGNMRKYTSQPVTESNDLNNEPVTNSEDRGKWNEIRQKENSMQLPDVPQKRQKVVAQTDSLKRMPKVPQIKQEVASPTKDISEFSTEEQGDLSSAEVDERQRPNAPCDDEFLSWKKPQNVKTENLNGDNKLKKSNTVILADLFRPVQENAASVAITNKQWQGKNFKKFKKKQDAKVVRKRISLVPYVRKAETMDDFDDFNQRNFDDEFVLNESHEDKFDWDAPMQSKNKKSERR